MSKRNKTQAPQSIAPVQGQKATFTKDGFSNFAASVGTNSNSLFSQNTYSFDFLTKNRILLEAMYRTSWIIGQAVDVPADDMTQGGIDIHATMPPDDTEALLEGLEDLKVWESLASTIRWGGLYGTGMGLILIDGQDMSTPLRLDGVGLGQFKGILPMDRWQLNPVLGDLITDLCPQMGMPKFYTTNPDSLTPIQGKIHHTRFIRIDGLELPHYQKQTENLWGESVIERIHDRLMAFDSTTMGAAQLVFKAYLRTWKIPNLRQLIATGGKAYDAVLKNVETMRLLQSNEGISLIDGEDTFETHSYSFSGLDSVLLQFGQQLSGALGIPLVRLFGQSPSGLNSSGESDLRTYYDGIRKKQKTMLRGPVKLILEIMSRSILGKPLPAGFNYEFRSLWQMTEAEKADIAAKDTTSITSAYDSGLISQATALKELRQLSSISGRFTNVTDEDIAAADDSPPSVEDSPDLLGAPANEDSPIGKSGDKPDKVA